MSKRPALLASLALAALVSAAPATAQDLQRPDGWGVRFDHPGATEADLEMFVGMPPGWHVTSGPAAIYWGPEMRAEGDFRLDMEVFLFDPEGLREAFGIFFGGSDLEGPNQRYSYFLIRDGGQFILKRRVGADAPTIQGWTSDDSVLAYADREEEGVTIRNELAVIASGDQVRFLVNGDEVATQPRSAIDVDGVFGFRVNHGLNLHISKMEMTPLD